MTTEGTRPVCTASRRSVRPAAWFGLAFFALQIGWLLATPAFVGIDEIDHAYRASSVSEGHWFASEAPVAARLGGGDYLEVRADVVGAALAACEQINVERPARCDPRARHGDEVVVASSAARYNPLYYAFVSPAAHWFHGDAALYAMRLCGAASCAALFGLAAWLTGLWARTRWPALGLLAAATPTTLYSGAIVAPNGAEIVSGLLLWTALLAWVRCDDRAPRRLIEWCAVLALVLLVNLHTLGLLWAGLITLTVVVSIGRARLREVWSARRPSALAAAVGVLGCAGSAAWTLLSRTNDPRLEPDFDFPLRLGALVRSIGVWPRQALGAFPDRFDLAPPAVYLLLAPLTLALVGVAAALGWRHRDRRLVAGLTGVAALSLVIPIVATVLTHQHLGIAWQGRYGMPYGVGMVMLAGALLDQHGRPVRWAWATLAAAGWAAASLVGQRAMTVSLEATGAWPHTAPSSPPLAVLAALAVMGGLGIGLAVRGPDRSVAAPTPACERAGTLTRTGR